MYGIDFIGQSTEGFLDFADVVRVVGDLAGSDKLFLAVPELRRNRCGHILRPQSGRHSTQKLNSQFLRKCKCELLVRHIATLP